MKVLSVRKRKYKEVVFDSKSLFFNELRRFSKTHWEQQDGYDWNSLQNVEDLEKAYQKFNRNLK